MTRGHIDVRSDRSEMHACQRGRGVMHMETPDGTTRPVEMTPGAPVYVPPHWVHRGVNVGRDLLVGLFCHPADAGQDYGIIERAGGMRTPIVDDAAGGRTEAESPRYRPRSPEEQRRYLAEPTP